MEDFSPAKFPLSFGVLAGGKSRRMGADKAWLTLRGRSFLETVLDAGSGFSERLVSLSADAEPFIIEGVKLVRDESADCGPLEGIRQLLRACTKDACLVTATDMPFLSADFLAALAARYPGSGNLALTLNGKFEPLCSIYARACLPEIDRLRAESRAKPSLLFGRVPTVTVRFEDMGFPERVLWNINRAEEYRAILEEGFDHAGAL